MVGAWRIFIMPKTNDEKLRKKPKYINEIRWHNCNGNYYQLHSLPLFVALRCVCVKNGKITNLQAPEKQQHCIFPCRHHYSSCTTSCSHIVAHALALIHYIHIVSCVQSDATSEPVVVVRIYYYQSAL